MNCTVIYFIGHGFYMYVIINICLAFTVVISMELQIEGKTLKNPQKAVLIRGMQGKRRTEMYVDSSFNHYKVLLNCGTDRLHLLNDKI